MVNSSYRELLVRYRWMEDELSRQSCLNKNMKEDFICLMEKEEWLERKVRSLKNDLLDLERAKKEELQRVSKGKAVLEAKLKKVEVQLVEQDDFTNKIYKEKMALQADFKKLMADMKDVSKRFSMLEEALGYQKSRMREAEHQHLETSKTTNDLKREKGALEAQLMEKSQEINRMLKEKADLVAEKRIMEEEEHNKFLELTRRVDDLAMEKEILEVELREEKMEKNEENKKKSELAKRIDLLEREKREMEDVQKRKFVALTEKVDALMREKIAVVDKLCETNKDNSEVNKKCLDLAERIGLLEREKQGLEEEIMKKDKFIKDVVEEKDSYKNMIKSSNTEFSKMLGIKVNKMKEVQLSQPSLKTQDVVGQGKQIVSTCKRKCTNLSRGKYKRHFSESISGGCFSGIFNSSSGGEVEDDSSKNRKIDNKCEAEEDLLVKFDNSPKLCLTAVCDLYKQNLLSATDHPVFKPRSYDPVVLAKYLVDGDPEMRLKKTVAEVEKFEPLVVVECRDIAKQYYKEIFEMWSPMH